jgi:DNA-binding response OmpR family regulator
MRNLLRLSPSPSGNVDPVAPETPRDPSFRVRPPLVLLVEDSADMRLYMRADLAEHYRVLEAAEGQQALALARERLPDVIVTDLMMPVMDGLELCRRLRRDELTRQIPVIILTARQAEEDQIRGLETGAADYLTKPFSLPVLLLKIHNLLESRLQLRERFSRQVFVQPGDIAITSADEQFLKRAIATVEEGMGMPEFDVERLARALAMSRSSLYRQIQRVTGQSVNEFIRTLRLQRAAQLLTQGQVAVAEAAFQVGFLDPSYFSRCFKDQFGLSPSDYEAHHSLTLVQ